MSYTRLIKNTFYYFIGIFMTKILQFVLIPIYTKYILTEEFGYYSFVISILSLVVPVLYQSIWEGILRFAIDDNENKKNILNSTSVYCLGLTTIYVIIYVTISEFLSLKNLYIILLLGISQMGVYYWEFSARALAKNKIYSIGIAVNTLVTLLASIIFIIIFKLGIIGLFLSNIFGNFIMIIILEMNIKLLYHLKIKEINIKKIKEIIRYSFPLSINSASWWLISSCNNLVITYRIGIQETGIYSLANKFGAIINLLTIVLNMACLEEMFRVKNEESQEYFKNVFDIFLRLLLGGVTLFIPITYIIYKKFIYGDYGVGSNLVPLIYLNTTFSCYASYLGSIFLKEKDSKIVFTTTLIGGIISSLGGYLIAPYFGVYGVVLTSVIGTFSMFIIRIPILIKRNIKIEIDKLLFLKLLVYYGLVYYWCSTFNDLKNLLVVSLVALIFFLFLNKKIIFFILKKIGVKKWKLTI